MFAVLTKDVITKNHTTVLAAILAQYPKILVLQPVSVILTNMFAIMRICGFVLLTQLTAMQHLQLLQQLVLAIRENTNFVVTKQHAIISQVVVLLKLAQQKL